jgi:hypothetical protein
MQVVSQPKLGEPCMHDADAGLEAAAFNFIESPGRGRGDERIRK